MKKIIYRRIPELTAGTFVLSVFVLAAFGQEIMGGLYIHVVTFPLSIVTIAIGLSIESLNPSILFNAVALQVVKFLPGLLEAIFVWWCLRSAGRPSSVKGWREMLALLGEMLAFLASSLVFATGVIIFFDRISAWHLGLILIGLGVLQAFLLMVHLRQRTKARRA